MSYSIDSWISYASSKHTHYVMVMYTHNIVQWNIRCVGVLVIPSVVKKLNDRLKVRVIFKPMT